MINFLRLSTSKNSPSLVKLFEIATERRSHVTGYEGRECRLRHMYKAAMPQLGPTWSSGVRPEPFSNLKCREPTFEDFWEEKREE